MPSLIVTSYFACVLLIAFRSARRHGASNSFFNATGELPTWLVTISFLAANCSGLEVLGLSGIAQRYGVQAFHFYWIGAIPAMVFVSFVMLPRYHRSKVSSVPEYLEHRYGRQVRLLSAFFLLATTCITAGVCLYGLAEVLFVFAGWSFGHSALIAAAVVLVSVMVAGFRGTARTEILHFFALLLGLVPLLYCSIHARSHSLQAVGTRAHLWIASPLASSRSPVDLIGVVVGLGVVISFSYWCSDFLLMQRALAARSLRASRRVPLYAGFGKLLFSLFVVFPVLLVGDLHLKGKGSLDQTMPWLMRLLFSPAFLPVGILALAASLMSGLAANVTAFASLWTQEIYRVSLRPCGSETHYIRVGRVAVLVCVLLSLAGAYATLHFESLSELLLAVFSLALIPLFAVILAGFSRRTSAATAMAGAVSGMFAGVLFRVACYEHWVEVGSSLNASFYVAIVAFASSLSVCFTGNLIDGSPPGPLMIVPDRNLCVRSEPSQYVLGACLLALTLLLNLLWR